MNAFTWIDWLYAWGGLSIIAALGWMLLRWNEPREDDEPAPPDEHRDGWIG